MKVYDLSRPCQQFKYPHHPQISELQLTLAEVRAAAAAKDRTLAEQVRNTRPPP